MWRVLLWRICSQPQNTFFCEDAGATNIYNCNYNGNHEPQQIDYILSSDTSLRSRTLDSSAANSDHWRLVAAVNSNRATTPRKNTDRKPIGWECRNRIGFKDEVRAFLNVDDCHLRGAVTEVLLHCLFSMMDRLVKIRDEKKCAGLGFTAK